MAETLKETRGAREGPFLAKDWSGKTAGEEAAAVAIVISLSSINLLSDRVIFDAIITAVNFSTETESNRGFDDGTTKSIRSNRIRIWLDRLKLSS